MKKLSILFAGLMIASTVFTSCSKDEESTASSNSIGKATVKGIAEANFDQAENKRDKDGNLLEPNGPVMEYIPSGTQLTATIESNDLVQDPNNQVNYAKKAYYTTVGANGAYEFTIDAGAENVNVKITSIDIIHAKTEYTQYDSSTGFQDSVLADGTPVYKVEVTNRVVWNFPAQNISVIEKDLKILDVEYQD